MSIYVGIGGWVYPDWRDNFYPKRLPQKRELEYASTHLTGEHAHRVLHHSHTWLQWRADTARAVSTFLRSGRFD